MPRPFRFSVSLTGMQSPGELVEAARRAEGLGYDAITLADHLDEQHAPLPALVAAAAATSTLRLATMVLANDFRHPAMLAKEAATVDVLTGGRFELGIGAGWMRSDFERAGLAFDSAGTRIARLGEAIAILKGLFAGEPFSFRGEHYAVDGLEGTPKPVQKPRPPIMVAGGGRRILGLGAREADVVGINPSMAAGVVDERAGATATPASTDEKVAWIRAAAGDRFDRLELQTRVHVAAITDDRVGFAATVAPALGISTDDALGSPHALAGTVDQCVETVLGWRERWGLSRIGFTGDAIDTMAPVVARLAGT